MPRRNVLHNGDKLPPLAPPPLELFQLPGQRPRRIVLIDVEKLSNQRDHLLHSRRVLFKHLPDLRFGLGESSRGDQRFGVNIPQLSSRLARVYLGLENKNRGPRLPLRELALAISQRDSLIGRIFLIGALIPRRTLLSAF